MIYRPIILIFLALLHIFAPFFNILGVWVFLGIGPNTYVPFLFQQPWNVLIESWVLLPLAGFAIYRMKPWSYPVFITILLYSGYRYWETYRQFPSAFSFIWVLTVIGLNIFLTSFFLLKAVRRPYFEKRLRWWESRTRYLVKLPVSFNDKETGLITDISATGVFVATEPSRELNSTIRLEFELFGKPMKVSGSIVHVRFESSTKPAGYGIAWKSLSLKNKWVLERAMFRFWKMNHPKRNPPRKPLLTQVKGELSEFFKDVTRLTRLKS